MPQASGQVQSATLAEDRSGSERPALGRLCVIVPAYNEGRSVGSVVRSVRSALPGALVLVVNDGSQDDTATAARSAGATVLSLPVNLGIGGAVQAGFRYAHRNRFDLAMQIDGDGQHDPSEAHRILQPIMEGDADMVVGSRWCGRGSYVAPSSRRFGMRVLSVLVRWRAGQVFTDTTSGFRAVGPAGIELFSRQYPTDFPEVEALVLARRNGLVVREVGVHMDQRTTGRSSIAGLRSAYYMARVATALIIDTVGRRAPT